MSSIFPCWKMLLGKMSKNKKEKKEEPFSRVQIRPENAKMGTKPKAVERGFVCVLFPYPRLLCCLAGEYLVSRALEMSWPADS